jgi:multidrug resistance efflux pump
MTKLALPLSLLLLCPAQTYALNSQDSGIRAGECEGLNKACTGAARELRAARELIKGYEAHIAAADDRIDLAQKEIRSLKELSLLQSARANELQNIIAAEREAKAVLVKLKDEQSKRIVTLEKQLGRSRKFALIAVVAAGIAILLGAAR